MFSTVNGTAGGTLSPKAYSPNPKTILKLSPDQVTVEAAQSSKYITFV